MMSISDNIFLMLHLVSSIRRMKNGVGFVSESLVPASVSVEPDLGVHGLVHENIQDLMDDHQGGVECATCVSVPSVSKKEESSHTGIVVFPPVLCA